MQKISWMVDNQNAADEVVDLIWNQFRVRGELSVVPLDGKIKIDLISEQELTPAQVQKVPGQAI